MKKRKKRIIVLLSLSLMLITLFFSIDGPYIINQGLQLFAIRRNMQDIDALLESMGLEPESRAFFALTKEIRTFAMNELGLMNSPNYSKYVVTDRTYLADVVSAVRADSLERYRRKYPLVGDVFYKGFFNKAQAERFAERLEKRGYDVLLRKVGAYSSLGLIIDPLFTYMRTYPEYKLAEMIIHEQVHATLWIPGQNQFNEEIATFIGREGAAEYIRRKYGADSPAYTHIQLAGRDRETLLAMVLEVYGELQDAYRNVVDKNERLRLKTEILARTKDKFAENYETVFLTGAYSHLIEKEWNLALIDLYLQYNEDLALYYELYESYENDIFSTISTLLSLEKENPKQRLRAQLGTPHG